jgi:hypothetical protein
VFTETTTYGTSLRDRLAVDLFLMLARQNGPAMLLHHDGPTEIIAETAIEKATMFTRLLAEQHKKETEQ